MEVQQKPVTEYLDVVVMLAVGGFLWRQMAAMDRRLTADLAAFNRHLTAEMAAVRREVREGLAAVRKEMHEGLADVREEMREGLAEVRSDLRDIDRRGARVEGQINAGRAVAQQSVPDDETAAGDS